MGRPKKDTSIDKKIEHQDNADRVEVERAFALAKHSYGLGMIMTKLDETTRSSIALSVIAMNVDRLLSLSFALLTILIFSRCKWHKNTPENLIQTSRLKTAC